MRKRLWSPDEDEKLQKYVSQHGFGNWSEVAKKTGLQRCGKSCRLRWINYLRPDLKRGKFSAEEKLVIVNLQKVFGNSWSKIAAHLPGRTDSDIKNFWHSHFRKKRPQQLLANTIALQDFLPMNSTLPHVDPSHSALMASIHQASSSQYPSLLNTSTSSYLHQSPPFNSIRDSITTNPSISMLKTPSSTIDIPSSSSILPAHLVPFSNSSHTLQLLNCATSGASSAATTKQGNTYFHTTNRQLSSNVPPSMSEEGAPLFNTKEEEEGDGNHEELTGNDFELINSLCQRAATWYNNENKEHGRVIGNSISGSKIGNDINIPLSMGKNDRANPEMLIYQSTSTSSHVHAPMPSPQNPEPEGLDLVVWSCVNRSLQVDQENILAPIPPHVTLANNLQNMAIKVHEETSFSGLET